MSIIFPSFAYSTLLKGNNVILKDLKIKLLACGGNLISESENDFSILASSNSFSFAIYPFHKDLKIDAICIDGKIEVIVTRVGERRAAIVFCSLVFILAVAIDFYHRQLKMWVLPFAAFLMLYLYGFLPLHPAHRKIKQILSNK